jgi:hypothetical protein
MLLVHVQQQLDFCFHLLLPSQQLLQLQLLAWVQDNLEMD